MNYPPELLNEKRWPHDDPNWPTKWNRVGGLIEMMKYVRKNTPANRLLIAELGVASGVSTEVFAQHGHVHAYDHNMWQAAYDRFKGREDEVTLVWSDTFAAADAADEQQYDLIYIDTVHEYDFLKREILYWIPRVRKGGFIAGHDHNMQFPGVQQAVNDVLGGADMIFADSSWIVRVE